MDWQNFTLSVQTPMFIGAAGPEKPGQLVRFPIPSLRGALRYWLRALVGAHLDDARVDARDVDLSELYAIERTVFGVASRRDDAPDADSRRRSMSAVAIRAPGVVPFVPRGGPPAWFDHERQITYLLGPGLWTKKDRNDPGILAGHIPVDARISLDARVQPLAPHPVACWDLFLGALWALRTFGGLGSRARRGWGGLDITAPPTLPESAFDSEWWTASSQEDVENALSGVLGMTATAMRTLDVEPREPENDLPPEYPCFRSNSYVQGQQPLGRTFTSAGADLAGVLRESRTGDATTTVTPEFETIVKPLSDAGQAHPGSTFLVGALGLPVVYTRRQPGTKARSLTVAPTLGGKEIRRASPLWLRIYHNPAGGWHLRSLAFLARWLPDDASLRMTEKAGSSWTLDPVRPSQDAVEEFLYQWPHREQGD